MKKKNSVTEMIMRTFEEEGGKKEEQKKRKNDLREFSAKINKTETEGGINRIEFKRYFGYKIPSEMLSDLVNSDNKILI